MDRTHPDLNLLFSLRILLEEGNVTRAAERMGITPSAMSQRLKRLQDALGDPILVKSGRGMMPTKFAESLRPALEELVGVVDRVFDTREFVPEAVETSLRIASTDQISLLFGESLETQLGAFMPGLDLHMLSVWPGTISLIQRGQVDLGVGFFRDPPAEFRLQHLFHDGYVCAVRRGHRFALEPTLEVFLEQRHVLVAPRGEAVGRVDLVLNQMNLTRRVARLEGSFLAALDLVSRTDLVVTVSRRIAERFEHRLGLELVEPPLALPNYALVQIWHERSHHDPVHRHVRHLLAQLSQELPAIPDAQDLVTVFG